MQTQVDNDPSAMSTADTVTSPIGLSVADDQVRDAPMPASATDANASGALPPGDATATSAEPESLTPIPRERSAETELPARSESAIRPSTGTPWYRHPLVALSAVLALILGVTWVFRRMVPAVRPMRSPALKVIGRVPISGKQSAVLLCVGQRMLLVGVSSDRLTTLAEFTDAEELSVLRGQLSPQALGGLSGFDADLSEQIGQYQIEHLDITDQEPDEGGMHLGETRAQLAGLLDRLQSLRSR